MKLSGSNVEVKIHDWNPRNEKQVAERLKSSNIQDQALQQHNKTCTLPREHTSAITEEYAPLRLEGVGRAISQLYFSERNYKLVAKMFAVPTYYLAKQ